MIYPMIPKTMWTTFLGELVWFVRPPQPGDRSRFVFVSVSCVSCVQTGEAKLRGGMTSVGSIAGPPGCEYGGVCPGGFACHFLLRWTMFLKGFGVFCVLQFVFVIIYMGFKDSLFFCLTVQ